MNDKDNPMSAEEAIWLIEHHMRIHKMGEYPHIRIAAALGLSLDALREKTARESTECEYCQGDEPIFAVEHDSIFVNEKGNLDVYCGESGNCPHLHEQINYCPMCGRRLAKGGN